MLMNLMFMKYINFLLCRQCCHWIFWKTRTYFFKILLKMALFSCFTRRANLFQKLRTMSVWEALFHPRSTDDSLLARFYRANIELSAVSDDINKTPSHSDERRLREALQAFRKARLDLMNLILKIMDFYIPDKRHK